ncbi:MAG: bifunctional phosphopantothenoylcysteine decarboxylase/phosphopantothenate--cysteine ligase CoaBC [Cyclobacteriaceae bacterium]|nr:bifunctional phosphopantothenoylcysteine decarboxylase/phosphopantothenate--cysteine ligase CoaBC [Cyclobacteriaceae bacterium]
MLQGKKILLGISGSIAAYKTAFLVRLLVKAGAEVKVIMTPASTEFISPLTLSTLSKNPALSRFVKNDAGEWNNHVELGLWGDLFLIAPATANTLAKMSQGLCDNLLLATYLSARCPVMIAPAMDLDMYKHPSTTRNLELLKKDGVEIIDAESGELASGLTGMGRMAEPEHILNAIELFFKQEAPTLPLRGKRAVITAGPTQEPLDPVRFISNHSTGKMGYALADQLKKQGCEVILVSGPVSITPPEVDKLIKIQTAKEMLDATVAEFQNCDLAILCAAVADYRPKEQSPEKIKKRDQELTIELIKTPDIAAELGKLKSDKQFITGFALETQNEEKNAISKLNSKNFDMIVLNSLKIAGSGFGHDTNKITIFDKHNNKLQFELKDKKSVAEDIVNEIIKRVI